MEMKEKYINELKIIKSERSYGSLEPMLGILITKGTDESIYRVSEDLKLEYEEALELLINIGTIEIYK